MSSNAASRPTLPATGLDAAAAYQALQAHDARFDGRLFVGVTSTGIYCRPVCRIRLPRRENCRFFADPAQAEAAGFRPCLRCRPELAPGPSLVDSSGTLAQAGAALLERLLGEGQDIMLTQVAERLGVTARHFRRIFQAAHGVSPVQWVGTRRLLLAKRLLTDTRLSVAQVAETAGFGSLRRFNAVFRERYRMAPGDLRRRRPEPSAPDQDVVRLFLPWRPPYDVAAMMDFLGARPLAGVEVRDAAHWRRTLSLDVRQHTHQGWLGIRPDPLRQGVELAISPGLLPALPQVIRRVRHLLDIDAEPADIQAVLGPLAGTRAGLRVPGCIDGFETTVRIILGQQVSVAAGCTLAARLVQALGARCDTPVQGLDRLFPTPAALLAAPAGLLGGLGIVRSRIGALKALAQAVGESRLDLSPGAPVQPTLAALQALPGIGGWTCEMVALRVLAWPDAFPAGDAGVLRALNGCTPQAALAQAEAWRPWRSYAVMHLWQRLAPEPRTGSSPPHPPPHEELAS